MIWIIGLGLVAVAVCGWSAVQARSRGQADALPHSPEMSTLAFPPDSRWTN
jgi:hypothetical protein